MHPPLASASARRPTLIRRSARKMGIATISVMLVLSSCGSDSSESEASAGTMADDQVPTTDVASSTAASPATTTMAPTTTTTTTSTIAPTTTIVAVLTVDRATETADEIAASLTSKDFTPIEELIGDEGSWVTTKGDRYDRTTVAGFLDDFPFIIDITRASEAIARPEGFAFEMSETFDNGVKAAFYIVLSLDDTGVLTVTELKELPDT